MSRQERTVIILFGLTVALWLTRADLRLGEQLRIPGWMTLLQLHHHVKETRYLPLPATASPTLSTPSPTTSPSSTSSSQINHHAALPLKTAPRAEILYQRQEISRKRPLVGDGFVAMLMALLLFLWPAGEGRRLLDWETALEIPWGMLLLFGGGFALAAGIKISGTSSWIGEIFRWKGLASFPTFGIILFLCLIITFLTEFTSNTATTEISLAMIAPVIATFGGTGVHPYLLMIPITLAASCAFMMPVATPPNAIVYASGLVPMREMVRLGFKLNLISALIISLLLYAVFLWMGIPLREKPPWL
jgi:di/tricarboxylate transporter